MKFALIVARKGSTRLPNKNRLKIAGKPLFLWSVEAAIQSCVFDQVWISSDDEEILAQASQSHDLLVDERPTELCGPLISASQVLSYMIDKIMTEWKYPKYFCLLLPTSPFLGAGNMSRAMSMLSEPETDFVVGVRRFGTPPNFAVNIENGVIPIHDGALTRVTQIQLVPEYFHPAGGIYAGRVDTFRDRSHFYGATTKPLMLDPIAAWDINDAEDIETARIIARGLKIK